MAKQQVVKTEPKTDKSETRKDQDRAVLVTGGSGFVGTQLARTLSERGRTVVSLYHHRVPESIERVYPVCSDLSSAELMAAPLRGVDAVVYLAWDGGLAGPQAPFRFEPFEAQLATRDLQNLRNVLTAMERAGTRRVVFVSAMGAHPDSPSAFLREKYCAELLVVNAKVAERLIVRPSVVWGGMEGKDRFLRSVTRVMRYPVYPVPRTCDRIAPLYVRDFANMLATSCDLPLADALSMVDVQGQESLDAQELFRLVSEKIVRKTRIALPRFIGETLLPFFEKDAAAVTAAELPRIKDVMALTTSSRQEASPAETEMLKGLFPEKMASFRERLVD